MYTPGTALPLTVPTSCINRSDLTVVESRLENSNIGLLKKVSNIPWVMLIPEKAKTELTSFAVIILPLLIYKLANLCAETKGPLVPKSSGQFTLE